MRNILFILLIASLDISGQNSIDSVKSIILDNKDLKNLSLVENILPRDIYGDTYISEGYCGKSFHLDSNFTFQQRKYCCTFDSIIMKGQWELSKNSLNLNFKDRSSTYYMIKYLDDYYFVQATEIQQLVLDIRIIQKESKKLSNKKGVGYAKYVTSRRLSQKYYVKKYYPTGT